MAGAAVPIRFDDRLVEAAVDLQVFRSMRAGDRSWYESYHRLADELYNLPPGPERAESFLHIYRYLFARLRTKERIENALSALPLLQSSISTVQVRKGDDDAADLLEKGGLLLQLRPETLLDDARLSLLLDSELLHVQDLVDPRFGFEKGSLERFPPGRREVVQRRYRLFWNLSVEARLSRAGRRTLVPTEQRREEFDRLYPSLSPAVRDRIFEAIRTNDSPTHGRLLALASDARELAAIGGVEGREIPAVFPGMPCPLCRFPTHDWGNPQTLQPAVREAIRRDDPSWEPGAGACRRCLELYELRATVSPSVTADRFEWVPSGPPVPDAEAVWASKEATL